jgi:hypothetical protein
LVSKLVILLRISLYILLKTLRKSLTYDFVSHIKVFRLVVADVPIIVSDMDIRLSDIWSSNELYSLLLTLNRHTLTTHGNVLVKQLKATVGTNLTYKMIGWCLSFHDCSCRTNVKLGGKVGEETDSLLYHLLLFWRKRCGYAILCQVCFIKVSFDNTVWVIVPFLCLR